MELLVSFTEEEVFVATVPSNWVEVSSPRLTEPTHKTPITATDVAKAARPTKGVPVSSPWCRWTHYYQGDRHACCFFPGEDAAAVHHEPLCPLPRFAETAHALWGEESADRDPITVIGILHEDTEAPLEVMWSSVMAMHLFQHPILAEMYIVMLTCMLSIVDLGFNTTVDDHLVPALWELPYSD